MRTPAAPKLIDELAKTKFSDKPTLAYRLKTGETAFAWQVRPALEAAAPRPKDVLVMVVTSASQAGAPLRQAGASSRSRWCATAMPAARWRAR